MKKLLLLPLAIGAAFIGFAITAALFSDPKVGIDNLAGTDSSFEATDEERRLQAIDAQLAEQGLTPGELGDEATGSARGQMATSPENCEAVKPIEKPASEDYVMCKLRSHSDILIDSEADFIIAEVIDLSEYTSLNTDFYDPLVLGDYVVISESRTILYRPATNVILADGIPEELN